MYYVSRMRGSEYRHHWYFQRTDSTSQLIWIMFQMSNCFISGFFFDAGTKKEREEVLGSTENKATELKQLKCYQLWYPHKRNMLTGEAFHSRYHTVKWVVMKLMWSVRILEDSRWNKKRDSVEKTKQKNKRNIIYFHDRNGWFLIQLLSIPILCHTRMQT